MTERVKLPKGRGRVPATNVWRATHDGRELEFARKKDALLYEQRGCPAHQALCCTSCWGWEPTR